MIKCPSCGHENVDGTQFCEMCGEELGAAASAPAAPAAGGAAASADAAPAGMVKCPACDNLNPADNVVCEVCGTELKKGALNTATPPAASAPAAPDASATPFDAPALGSSATAMPSVSTAPAASTAASAPVPVAADTATSTDTDASLPVVSISSADPLTTDPLDTPTTPTVTMPSSMPQTAPATTPTSGGTLEPGKVRLVVEQGMTVGKQFVLGDAEVQVGREDEEDGIYPDIDLSDQDEGYVHRRHAVLKFENGGLSVTHLGGANKTRVNNKPLADNAPQPVSIGDKVAFGKVVMRVQSN